MLGPCETELFSEDHTDIKPDRDAEPRLTSNLWNLEIDLWLSLQLWTSHFICGRLRRPGPCPVLGPSVTALRLIIKTISASAPSSCPNPSICRAHPFCLVPRQLLELGTWVLSVLWGHSPLTVPGDFSLCSKTLPGTHNFHYSDSRASWFVFIMSCPTKLEGTQLHMNHSKALLWSWALAPPPTCLPVALDPAHQLPTVPSRSPLCVCQAFWLSYTAIIIITRAATIEHLPYAGHCKLLCTGY